MDIGFIKVLMVVTGFVMSPDGPKQVWETSDEVYLSTCMTMSSMFSGVGKAGAIIVKCSFIGDRKYML